MGWQDGTPTEGGAAQPAWMQGAPVSRTPLPNVSPEDGKAPSGVEALAGNAVTRFALGAASPVLGAAQLLANVSPVMRMGGLHDKINEHLQQLEQIKNAGMNGTGAEGTDFIGIGGAMLNPAGFVAAKALPVMSNLGGRMAQGAGFGAAMGATTPVVTDDFAGTKAIQTGAGAAIGGAVPAAVAAIKGLGATARDVADLFTAGGAERIFLKYQNRILGQDPASRQAVVQALRTADEYVKGSKPTAAEAMSGVPAASPMIEYQRILAATPGGPSGNFGQRLADQEAARMNALRTVGKTPEDIAKAEAARSENAAANYGPIMPRQVNPKSDVEIMQEAIAAREASRVAALQDQGRFQTTAAQQNTLSARAPIDLAGQQAASRAGNLATGTPAPFNSGGVPAGQTPNTPYFNVGATGGRVPAEVARDGSLPANIPFQFQGSLPPRMNTANYAQSLEAETAARDAGRITVERAKERDFLQQTFENLRNTVGMSDDSLTKYLGRPSMQAAIKDAAQSAAEKGSYFPSKPGDKFSVENLQRIKESLDSGILAASNAARAGKRPELSEAELTGTRQAFVRWLGNKVPEWRDARQQYSADSREIDQMRVGQNLMGKLVSATGKETPESFAAAVRNEAGTIKRATGQQRYGDIKELMTPNQNEVIDNVLRDVTRRARAYDNRQGTNLYGGVNVAEETIPRLPNMLSRPAMIANALMRARSNKIEQEIDRIGADAYLNPQKLADLLEKMPAARRNRLMSLLEDSRNTAVTAAPVYSMQGQQ